MSQEQLAGEQKIPALALRLRCATFRVNGTPLSLCRNTPARRRLPQFFQAARFAVLSPLKGEEKNGTLLTHISDR